MGTAALSRAIKDAAAAGVKVGEARRLLKLMQVGTHCWSKGVDTFSGASQAQHAVNPAQQWGAMGHLPASTAQHAVNPAQHGVQ